MVKRLTVFIFIFVVGIGLLTETPIYAQKSEMIKCCKSAFKSGATLTDFPPLDFVVPSIVRNRVRQQPRR